MQQLHVFLKKSIIETKKQILFLFYYWLHWKGNFQHQMEPIFCLILQTVNIPEMSQIASMFLKFLPWMIAPDLHFMLWPMIGWSTTPNLTTHFS